MAGSSASHASSNLQTEHDRVQDGLLAESNSDDDSDLDHRVDSSMRRSRHNGSHEAAASYDDQDILLGSVRGSTNNSAADDQDQVVPPWSIHAPTKKHAQISWLRLIILSTAILLAFLALLYGALRASVKTILAPDVASVYYNGSSHFAPTTILVSLDGFRADFLLRGLTPHLNALIASGVSPDYMLPSFPSVTFPNHYTLVTGLYPESHGIVGNSFWDPTSRERYHNVEEPRSLQAKWFQAEALWETAESQGLRTAIHMWPGSEMIREPGPSYLARFNSKEPLDQKVKSVLDLLDLPGKHDASPTPNKPRPQFIATYVPNVDAYGHKYGPNSTQMHRVITSVDDMIGTIVDGLHTRNLTHIVNLIVVSDHGMASTSVDRLVQLDDIIDMSLVEQPEGWPLFGLRPKRDEDLSALHAKLVDASKAQPGFDVHLRDTDMPPRFHFSNNDRIAPLFVIPHTGWAIVTRPTFDVAEAKKSGKVFRPKGIHGYDHENQLMRAIFIASGPDFPNASDRLDAFQNTEVYQILCDVLRVKPNAHNGTLKMPLVTTRGHHALDGAKHVQVH